jgi:Protein of unknown function (DUF1194)
LVSLLAALLSLTWISTVKAQEFDSWLVLVVDVSSSVSDEEYLIQKEGYVSVLQDPMIGTALDRTAVAIVEFSSDSSPVVDWNKVAIAGAVYSAMPRSSHGLTCVSCGLHMAMNLLEGKSGRRVIDISADGCENTGNIGSVLAMRDATIASGIEINTLSIMAEPDTSGCEIPGETRENHKWEGETELARWYAWLATGFSLSINNLEDLVAALHRKLFAEIAYAP